MLNAVLRPQRFGDTRLPAESARLQSRLGERLRPSASIPRSAMEGNFESLSLRVGLRQCMLSYKQRAPNAVVVVCLLTGRLLRRRGRSAHPAPLTAAIAYKHSRLRSLHKRRCLDRALRRNLTSVRPLPASPPRRTFRCVSCFSLHSSRPLCL